MICALAMSDYQKAHAAYSEMSSVGRNSEETQYLMYKVGLRTGSTELGASNRAILLIVVTDAAQLSRVLEISAVVLGRISHCSMLAS